MNIKFTALGGALDPKGVRPPIGGSLYLLQAGDAGIVFDAGLYPQSEESLSKFRGFEWDYVTVGSARAPVLPKMDLGVIGDDDFIFSTPERSQLPQFQELYHLKTLIFVLTHGHLDHGGAMPYLLRRFPRALVLMTRPTQAISEWTWRDTLGIARKEKRPPLYGGKDIEHALRATMIVEENTRMEIGPFIVSFFPAGHILGAVGCLVEVSRPEGVPLKVLLTGDMTLQDQHTVSGAAFPADLSGVHYLISECTNGGGQSLVRADVERRLAREVELCISNRGKALLGAFSIARAQEIFAVLRTHGITNRCKVYIDGAARFISAIYAKWVHDLHDIDVHFVGEDMAEREAIARSREPLVMIAPAGMYTTGWSVWYARQWADDSRNLIAITSYQDPCSLGHQLLHGDDRARVKLTDGLGIAARVREFKLSAHMSGEEIHRVADIVQPSVGIFLVHGNERGMKAVCQESPYQCVPTYIGNPYVL